MGGFGEVDLNNGAVTFTVNEGRSSIESQQSARETFQVVMDKPRMDVLMASDNGHTFNVYVEDGSGLVGIETGGILG